MLFVAADVPVELARAALGERFDALLAGRIGDGDERRTVAVPLPFPLASDTGVAVRADRAFP